MYDQPALKVGATYQVRIIGGLPTLVEVTDAPADVNNTGGSPQWKSSSFSSDGSLPTLEVVETSLTSKEDEHGVFHPGVSGPVVVDS